MKLSVLKKTALLGLALLVFSSGPLAWASPYDRQVVRIASLMVEETSSWDPRHDLLEIANHVATLARRYDLDPLLILAIIKVESGFRTQIRSHAGAIGLMQVMPIVLREVGHEIAVTKKEELYDPYKNLHLGIHYLTYLLEKYGHDLRRALVAYNLGPSALDERLSQREGIPQGYFRKVMRSYRNFQKRSEINILFI